MYLKYVLEAALEIGPQLPARDRPEATAGHVRDSRNSHLPAGVDHGVRGAHT